MNGLYSISLTAIHAFLHVGSDTDHTQEGEGSDKELDGTGPGSVYDEVDMYTNMEIVD